MISIDYMSLAMALVVIVLFVTPLYLHVQRTKKKKANALQRLEEFSGTHGWKLTEYEIWRSRYFLGIDAVNLGLVYIEEIAAGTPISVDLREIDRVRMIERSHEIVSSTEKRKIIDAIELQLIGSNGQVAHRLEVYDGDRYSDLDGEAVLAKKWETQISKLLKESHKGSLVK